MQLDEKFDAFTKTAKEKLDKATVYYNHIQPLINDFDNSSANAIAKIIPPTNGRKGGYLMFFDKY